MPKKRRKAIITETTPDIPFQKVRVEWVDCVSDSAWANEKEFDKIHPIYRVLFLVAPTEDNFENAHCFPIANFYRCI